MMMMMIMVVAVVVKSVGLTKIIMMMMMMMAQRKNENFTLSGASLLNYGVFSFHSGSPVSGHSTNYVTHVGYL